VGVDQRRPVECLGDHLGHERDAGGPADQQHRAEVGGLDLRRPQGAGQRTDRRLDLRPDHVLELRAGQAHVEVPVGQEHRDRRLGVDRQRLLGQDAVLAQPGQRDGGLRVAHVQLRQRSPGAVVDVGQHRVVEVDAAEAFDALRGAQDVDAGSAFAQDGGVEGAAAEVVHRHDVAVGELAGGGVVRRCGFGLGDHPRLCHAGDLGNLLEQLAPVRPPVGRVGEYDCVRGRAFGLRDPRDGVGQQGGEQGGGRVRRSAEHHRHRVTEAALELAADPVRAAYRPTAGGLAGDDGAVLAGVHHRRRDHRPVAEGEHLDA
jgi:hypothetical protein